LPIDFVILDMPEDSRILIILVIPFLATARAMIDVFNRKITFRIRDDEELLAKDQSDSFILKGLERGVNQIELEDCGPVSNKIIGDPDIEKVIRRIKSLDMAYSGE
nr:hypothetical protein [Tanacetum cinerariifolium]